MFILRIYVLVLLNDKDSSLFWGEINTYAATYLYS